MADSKTRTVKAKVIRPRGVNHDGAHHAKDAVIKIAQSQFDDWKAVGIVEAADSPAKAKSDIGPEA